MLLGLLLFQFLGTGVLLLLVNLLKSKLFLKMFFLIIIYNCDGDIGGLFLCFVGVMMCMG